MLNGDFFVVKIISWLIFFVAVALAYLFVFSNAAEWIRIFLEKRTRIILEKLIFSRKQGFGRYTVIIAEILFIGFSSWFIGMLALSLIEPKSAVTESWNLLVVPFLMSAYSCRFLRENYPDYFSIFKWTEKFVKVKDLSLKNIFLKYAVVLMLAFAEVFIAYLFSLVMLLAYLWINMEAVNYFWGLLITPTLLVAMIYCTQRKGIGKVEKQSKEEAEKQSNARRVIITMGLVLATIRDAYFKYLELLGSAVKRDGAEELYIMSTLVLFIAIERFVKAAIDSYNSIKNEEEAKEKQSKGERHDGKTI